MSLIFELISLINAVFNAESIGVARISIRTRLLRLAAQASCLVVERRFFSWPPWVSEHEAFEKNPTHVSETCG